jgi:hypothetical protein
MKSMQRRLAALERRIKPDLIEITVTGGFPPKNLEFRRVPDESWESFRARARTAAKERGASIVIYRRAESPEDVPSELLDQARSSVEWVANFSHPSWPADAG